jgi:hypothetical protein
VGASRGGAAALPGAAADPAGSAPTDSTDANSADTNLARVEAAHRHTIAHDDLMVVAQPGSTPTGCAPSGYTPFGSTLAGPPGRDSAWRDLQATATVVLQLAGAGASAEGATPLSTPPEN